MALEGKTSVITDLEAVEKRQEISFPLATTEVLYQTKKDLAFLG